MLDLKITLKELRPNLSASSITTYDSILRNLHKKVYDKEPIDMKNFNKVKPILEELKQLPVNRRKTILSALTVLTDNKKYRDAMLDDIKEYNTQISKQKKTITQEENWWVLRQTVGRVGFYTLSNGRAADAWDTWDA